MILKRRSILGQYRGTDIVDRIHHPTVRWAATQLTGGDHLAWVISKGRVGWLELRTPQIVRVRIFFGFTHDKEDESRMALEAWMMEEDRKIASAHMARMS